MRWALAALTVAAFLTFVFEATAEPDTASAVAIGSLYTVTAIGGYAWVDERTGPRGRTFAIAFVVWQLAIGYAVFGAVPQTGATLLLCVLVAQTVHLLGIGPAAVLVVVIPLMHVGMDMGDGLRAAAGSLIAGAFAAVSVGLYEREQRARAELAVAHERLRGYAEQAEELATTRERNRVARDIHDGLGHHLTVVAMQVQAARAVLRDDPARADAVLEKAQAQSAAALAEVRRSVGALREPRTLPPLPEALAALTAEASAAGVVTDLEVAGAARDLDAEHSEALYRTAQEGLTNVRKHAAATSARVLLDFTAAGAVTVEVRDDGRGDGAGTGFGLVGLRERAEALGGTLVRHAVPGEGTTLRVELPRMSVRVLLVDDQALFREALAMLLDVAPGIEVVGEAGNGAEAVEQATRLRPDVVLMDLRMPVLDGIAATRRLRAELPDVRVLALTTFDDDDEVFAALRAGALGYLLKDVSSARLVEAVQAAARGESVLQPSVAAKVVARIASMPDPRPRPPPQPLVVPLSERELAVVRLLADGRSNREIAGELFLAEGTVKNHVTNVLTKLDARDRTQAALRARALGLA